MRDDVTTDAQAPSAREICSLTISMVLIVLGAVLGLDYFHGVGAIGDDVFYVALFLVFTVPMCTIMAAVQERRAYQQYVGAGG